MSSEKVSQSLAFFTIFIITITFSAIITYVSGATIPLSRNNALNYINSINAKKIIIDVDGGVDDAMAIILALAKKNPNYPEVLAITCVNGNTNVDQVAINVLKTLRVINRTDIPVYIGGYNSLTVTPESDGFYGEDGFGDVPDKDPPKLSEAKPEHAVDELVRLVAENPSEIAVITLGPLTNIGMAIRMDRNFRNNLKAIYWLGGSIRGVGNVHPGIEFNAFMDPESNYIVLSTDGPPVVIFSWETCIVNAEASKKWREDVLAKVDSPIVHFLNAIEAISLSKANLWTPCDAKAMSLILEHSIVVEASQHYVQALYQGDGRGGLMVDYGDKLENNTKNAVIVEKFNDDKFKQLCLENFS